MPISVEIAVVLFRLHIEGGRGDPYQAECVGRADPFDPDVLVCGPIVGELTIGAREEMFAEARRLGFSYIRWQRIKSHDFISHREISVQDKKRQIKPAI